MWPLPTPQYTIVSINIDPEGVACYAFSLQKKKILLRHYAHFDTAKIMIINGIIFNSTALHSHINKFIIDNDLAYSYGVLAITQPSVTQELCTTNAVQDIYHQHAYNVTNRPILSLLSDRWYYLSTISEQYLFHYKLFLTRLKLHCLQITTPILALLTIYELLYPKNIITYDKQTICSLYDHCMNAITINDLENCVTIASNITLNKTELARGVGLFLLGKKTYEQS